jgi:serine protease Do
MKKNIYFSLALALLVVLNPMRVSADPPQRLRQANVLLEAGRVDEAAQLMRGFEPSDAREEYAFYLLGGKVAMARGQAKRAVDYFENAQRLSGGNYVSTIGLARAQMSLGHLVAARLQADAARALNPSSAEIELVHAEVDERMGKRDRAIQRMEALTRSRPGSEEAAIARARLLTRLGDSGAATELLSQFLKGNPSSAGVAEFLGELKYRSGDRAVGIQLKQQAANLYSEQGNAFRRDVMMAWIEVSDTASNGVVGKFEDEQSQEPRPKVTERVEKIPVPAGAASLSGSGFVIDGGRKIVTNWHVVDGGKKFIIRTSLGELIPARVLESSQTDDIAILELEKPLPVDRAVADTAYVKPVVGTSIVVMGFPLSYMLGDNAPSLTNGIVSKVTGLRDDVTSFQLTAKINKGNSGGPVFDMRGNVVGVAFGKLDVNRINQEQGFIPEDVNFAVHVDRLPRIANTRMGAPQSVDKDLSIESLYQKMLDKVVMVLTYR